MYPLIIYPLAPSVYAYTIDTNPSCSSGVDLPHTLGPFGASVFISQCVWELIAFHAFRGRITFQHLGKFFTLHRATHGRFHPAFGSTVCDHPTYMVHFFLPLQPGQYDAVHSSPTPSAYLHSNHVKYSFRCSVILYYVYNIYPVTTCPVLQPLGSL